MLSLMYIVRLQCYGDHVITTGSSKNLPVIEVFQSYASMQQSHTIFLRELRGTQLIPSLNVLKVFDAAQEKATVVAVKCIELCYFIP